MDFNKVEESGKAIFKRFPQVRRVLKRTYQLASVATDFGRVKVEGDFKRISPVNEYEYFYGYYDKSPWDKNDRYVLAVRVKDATEAPAPLTPGHVVLIDTFNDNHEIIIGETNTWNSQQGCMAQWVGPDFATKVIYNDFRSGKFVSVLFNIEDMEEERVYSMPVYDVSRDGKFAMSLDFSRLHRLRPGYGYSNLPDLTEGNNVPNETALWKLDLLNGEVEDLMTYSDFTTFEPRDVMRGAEHKINHIMINPTGRRMMILHRWYLNGEKFTRLVTVNTNGKNLYNLNENNFTSHSYWKNDKDILTFARKEKEGKGYFMLHDGTQDYKFLWPELNTDGHMSYSPDGKRIVTDTYPNRKRMASLFVNSDSTVTEVGRVYAPFKYDNDVRCDLHPRWNRMGNQICIDSVHEGKRAMYVLSV